MNFKKMLCLMTSIVILVASLTVTVGVKAQEQKTVLEFNDSDDLIFSLMSSIIGDDADAFLSYNQKVNAYTMITFQTSYELLPETKYKISIKYKYNGEKFNKGLWPLAGNGSKAYNFCNPVSGWEACNLIGTQTNSYTDSIYLEQNTEWALTSFVLDTAERGIVDSTYKYLGFCFQTYSSGTYELYIDSVTVEMLDKKSDASQYIFNGDFENGDIFWNDEDDISLVCEEADSLNKNLNIKGGSYSKIYQTLNLKPNTNYRISFDYKGMFSGITNWGISNGKPDASGMVAMVYSSLSDTDSWQNESVIFTTGNSPVPVLFFQSGIGCDFYIDNIVIEETQELPQEKAEYVESVILDDLEQHRYITATHSNLIKDSGFEGEEDISSSAVYANITNHSASQGSFTNITEDEKSYLNYNASVTNYTVGGILTDYRMETDTNYKITLNYKSSNTYKFLQFCPTITTKNGGEYIFRVVTGKNDPNDYSISTNSVYLSNNGNWNTVEFLVDTSLASYMTSDINYLSFAFKTYGSGKSYNFCFGDILIECLDESNDTIAAGWKTLTEFGNMSVVDFGNAHSGSKVLKFEAAGLAEDEWSYCYYKVIPNTNYYFSVWVLGEQWDETNKNDLRFGIADANTGEFIVTAESSLYYTEDDQMCPPAWDGEWHLVNLHFTTGTDDFVAIAFRGSDSLAYFDEMQLFPESQSIEYIPKVHAIEDMTVTSETPELIGCEEENNLFGNYNLAQINDDYWQSGINFGQGDNSYCGNFVDILSVDEQKGNSLYYSANDKVTKYPLGTYYIKWIDVTPETEYTFSAIYDVVESGNGFFGIIDGNDYYPTLLKSFDFSNITLGEWKSAAFSFNTGGYTKIGFVIADMGGKAAIDNLRLFESQKGIELNETEVIQFIASDKYNIDAEYIYEIDANTELSVLQSQFNNGYNIGFFDNEDKTSGNGYTGLEVRLLDDVGHISCSTNASYTIGGIKTSYELEKGKKYQVRYKYKTTGAAFNEFCITAADLNKTGYNFFRVVNNSGNPSNYALNTENINTNSSEWKQISTVVDTLSKEYVSSSNKYLSFAFKTYGSNTYGFMMDDITVTPMDSDGKLIEEESVVLDLGNAFSIKGMWTGGTGNISYISETEKLYDKKICIVNFDLDFDGNATASDISLIRKALLGIEDLENIQLMAANCSSNTTLSIKNLVRIKKYIAFN